MVFGTPFAGEMTLTRKGEDNMKENLFFGSGCFPEKAFLGSNPIGRAHPKIT